MYGRAENIAAGKNRCDEEGQSAVARERWEIYAKMEGRRKGLEVYGGVDLFIHLIAYGREKG